MNGCLHDVSCQFLTGFYNVQHGAVVAGTQSFTNSVLDLTTGYLCLDGATGFQLLGQTTMRGSVDVQVFACSGSRGLLVTDQSAWINGTALFVYGGSNTFTVAVEVRSGCSFQYITNKPSILGNNPGVNDIKLGGTDYGWGSIPLISAVNGAMAVVRQ
jgi:hypothetical protein